LAHSCPTLFPVVGDAIVHVHEGAGEGLLGFLRPDIVPGQVGGIMDIPAKP
jgi:hypothetical protein